MKIEYFLMATNECNLHCQYCSVLGNELNNRFPQKPQYSNSQLINFIIKNQELYKSEQFDVYFFGGEPSLNQNYIISVIDCFKSKLNSYKIRYILHTNGLLLSSISKNILDNIDLVIISINYEKIPQYNLFDSYFGQILLHINKFKDSYKTKIMARLTITEKVSLYNNVIQISNFFDYVYWQIQNCYQFEDFNRFYRNYSFDIELLWSYWYKYFKQSIVLNFVPFSAFINLLVNKPVASKEYLCGYNSFMIYIQTDGSCYSCSEEVYENNHFKIGDIFNGISFVKQNTENLKLCHDCNYYFFCRGRCGRMQERFNLPHIKEYCKLNIFLFETINQRKEEINQILSVNNQLRQKINDIYFSMTEYVP